MVGSNDLPGDDRGASGLVSCESEESSLSRGGKPGSDLADAGLETRVSGYLLLARLLRTAPSEALLKEVVQNGLLTLVERIGHPATAGVMLDPAEDVRWPDQVQTIAVDFARLFAVPGEHAVRPYESAYCDTIEIDASTACSTYVHSAPSCSVTGLLHGPSATAVRAVYRQAGFELDPAVGELPDHVAVELEFVGRLLERAAEREAAAFFQAHLGRWVFRCLHGIKRHAQIAFYRTVADVAETFLRFEERAFAMMDERHVHG